MRLPEAKIKEAIIHPDRWIRSESLQYFTDAYSADPDVMSLAIQAIETHGRGHAFLNIRGLVHLAQSETTIDWIIRQLNLECDDEKDGFYFAILSELLCNADPRHIVPRADAILEARNFSTEAVAEFEDQLDVASWTADQCGQELDRVADSWISDDEPDFSFDHVRRVVKRQAVQGERMDDRILDLLHKEVTDFEDDPMVWMEIFLVMLAGEMRLKAAIPLILKKLHQCAEFLSEECVDALVKMGGDAEVEAVVEGWHKAEWDYRYCATGVLANIHCDTSVRKCLDLLTQEPNADVRTLLADAFLRQFADEDMEPIRDIVRQENYDSYLCDLKAKLVAVSTLLGVTFPECSTWKAEVEQAQAESERRLTKAPSFNVDWPEYSAPKGPAYQERRADFPGEKPAPFHRHEKVGRNDTCPCGSGKKFKKCCMSRSK